ncbi:saccharopine dehydrogenase family protein [Micromonospora zhanjiangensis]|uniref:Saccharopine dehydrogenase family protein n=1 Tax=Micromonospora zhanjiangensis TaxID=1522057 RepID=A0ABV8KSX0_9ACTN
MRIAVYGATGYQAGLVLAELARRNIDMVLVGRDGDRVRAAAAAVDVGEPRWRVAHTDDHDAMVAAFRDADTVVNCAGPFTPTGPAVVRAAVAAGCHYVDTAGEQLYLDAVFRGFATAAEDAGVTVVPGTNDACLPVDLVARLLAERVDPIEEVIVSHLVVGAGGMSRGSLRSLAETIDVVRSGGLVYQDGEWRGDVPARPRSVVFPDAAAPTTVARFPLPEVVTIPRHTSVRRVEGLADAALGARLATPLAGPVIAGLPAGPSEDDRRGQRFTYVVDVSGADGRWVRGVVRGVDTYGSTATISVEAARRLALGGTRPGVLVPAQAFDPTDFLDFLGGHGIDWTITLLDGVPVSS